jgi:hypothetical protein
MMISRMSKIKAYSHSEYRSSLITMYIYIYTILPSTYIYVLLNALYIKICMLVVRLEHVFLLLA